MDIIKHLKPLSMLCFLVVIYALLEHTVCEAKQKQKEKNNYKSLYKALVGCSKTTGAQLCRSIKGKGVKIIQKHQVCNGFMDCPLGDDEENCRCGQLPNVEFGYYALDVMDRMTTEAQASLRCYPDYKRVGSPSITCERNGQWSLPQGLCTPRKCKELPPTANGMFVPLSDTVVNSLAILTCNRGFYAPGVTPPTILCQTNMNWTRAERMCAKRCGTLPTVANGHYVLSAQGDTVLGSDAVLQCQLGYSREGPKLIKCIGNDFNVTWGPHFGTCNQIDCGDPPPKENGKFTVLEGGQSACLTCNANYFLTGDASPGIICNNTGFWTKTSASCIKSPGCECPCTKENPNIDKQVPGTGCRSRYICMQTTISEFCWEPTPCPAGTLFDEISNGCSSSLLVCPEDCPGKCPCR